jgi:hypothetical protein
LLVRSLRTAASKVVFDGRHGMDLTAWSSIDHAIGQMATWLQSDDAEIGIEAAKHLRGISLYHRSHLEAASLLT